MKLFQVVLAEAGTRCGISTTHDLKTIMGRVEHEGISFLTISLSNFGKDFEKSLDQGSVADDQFPGFSRTGGLPRLFGGFLRLVFDASSARLIDVPSVDAIQAIRQLCFLLSKINLECSDARVARAFAGYIETERTVRLHDKTFIEIDASGSSPEYRFRSLASRLWGNYFSRIDNRLYEEGITPKHGKGATADRLVGNDKYHLSTWTERLNAVYPDWEFLLPSPRYLCEADRFNVLSPGSELPVRVITVPKTLKTPRIIAMEPSWMQYAQQGLLEVIVQEMRTDDNARNFVLNDSQEPNRALAFEGSLTGNLATLDLSEASDRVSNQHVRALVANHAELRLGVDATRSRKADVPGYGVIRLAKFASMGSALCFPFEALVFTTVIFLAIEKDLNRRLTQKDFESYYGKVRVYGDDIIVPVDHVQSVVQELEAFGFQVNRNKSFWTGKFRESCGKEYYHGHDVSYVKVRSILPTSRRDVQEIQSAVEFRNLMYHQGYWSTASYMDQLLERIIPFPVVEPTSSLLGRHSIFRCQADGFDPHLHLPLVKGAVVESKLPAIKTDNIGALLKCFLKRGDEPFADQEHLERSGRPNSARIKIRWSSPF